MADATLPLPPWPDADEAGEEEPGDARSAEFLARVDDYQPTTVPGRHTSPPTASTAA